MVKAVWKDKVIAESDKTKIVEKNHYFPPDSIKKEYFRPSSKNTTYQCSWKGKANYYDIVLMEKLMRMLPGIILNQKKQQKILKVI